MKNLVMPDDGGVPLALECIVRQSRQAESRYRCHMVRVITEGYNPPKVVEFADVRLELN